MLLKTIEMRVRLCVCVCVCVCTLLFWKNLNSTRQSFEIYYRIEHLLNLRNKDSEKKKSLNYKTANLVKKENNDLYIQFKKKNSSFSKNLTTVFHYKQKQTLEKQRSSFIITFPLWVSNYERIPL